MRSGMDLAPMVRLGLNDELIDVGSAANAVRGMSWTMRQGTWKLSGWPVPCYSAKSLLLRFEGRGDWRGGSLLVDSPVSS
jgi:hypothetical protein